MKRWWWFLLLLPVAVGLARLRFDADVLNLLPPDLPVVEGLKLHQRYFSDSDELMLTLQANDAESAETFARTLALELRGQTNLISRALWQSPWVEHPDHTAELIALSWLNQPPGDFSRLTNRLAPNNVAAVLESSRNTLATSLSPDVIARLGYDPLGFSDLPASSTASTSALGAGEQFFASADGTFRLIYLKPATPLESYQADASWLKSVESSVNKIRRENNLPAGVRVGYTGAPAFIAQTAGGMERDMTGSAIGTLAIIGLLFWWTHRRLQPLLWLVVFLALILAGTMALGGFVFGRLNIVSLGFAAILLGLAVDYALVLYQESLTRPLANSKEVRREVQRGIVWSALTTAGAYLLLNFSPLPGLAQLGTLVALGILLGAAVMLYSFLPAVLRNPIRIEAAPVSSERRRNNTLWPWLTTCIALTGGILILCFRAPVIDHSADALSPTDIPGFLAMEEINSNMTEMDEPLWLLVSGDDETKVAQRMGSLVKLAHSAEARPWFTNVTFPTALWPNVPYQQTNLLAAVSLCNRKESFHHAIRSAGFTDEAWHLADEVLKTWQQASGSKQAIWPTNFSNRWLLEKVAARTDSGWLALGTVQTATNPAPAYAGAMSVFNDGFAST